MSSVADASCRHSILALGKDVYERLSSTLENLVNFQKTVGSIRNRSVHVGDLYPSHFHIIILCTRTRGIEFNV